MEEWQLVLLAARGDRTAFADLTRRYYRPVASFLFKRAGQADLVEDLTQETFLQAFQSLTSGRKPEHFTSWLFGIAHNCWGKWARRKQVLSFSAAAAPPEEVPERPNEWNLEEIEHQQHVQKQLAGCLAELPEDTRRILDLKHQHGKTCEEIARELQRPVGTIKSLLARTYRTLRGRLSPGGSDDPSNL